MRLSVLKLTAFIDRVRGCDDDVNRTYRDGHRLVGVEEEQARIGRPVTPGSVAGAARRPTLRAFGSCAGARAVAPVVRCGC